MKRSKSLDSFNMLNDLLKYFIPILAQPFAKSINYLLDDGILPDQYKISCICPGYKKGPMDQPHTYEAISIIPFLGKLVELFVYEQIEKLF